MGEDGSDLKVFARWALWGAVVPLWFGVWFIASVLWQEAWDYEDVGKAALAILLACLNIGAAVGAIAYLRRRYLRRKGRL